MSRIEPIDIDSADEELRAVLEKGRELLGFMPNDGLVMAHNPALLKALAGLIGVVWGPGEIDTGLKRLIGEMSSKTAGCMYCTAHAANSAYASGVPQDKLDAIWDFESSDVFTEAERVALRFAMLASQSPAATSNADFDALKAHYSTTQIVEIMSVIATFGFLNRWNDNLATTLEDIPAGFAEKHLSSTAWSGSKHQ